MIFKKPSKMIPIDKIILGPNAKMKKGYISYYEEMKPALTMLQLLGRFPYRITDTGLMDFSLFSIPTIYSLLFFIASCALSMWSDMKIFEEKILTAKEFDTQIVWVVILLFSMLTFLVPLTFWLDSPNTVSYIRKWKYFEDFGRSDGIEVRSARPVRIVSYLAIPFSFLFLSLEVFFIEGMSVLVYIQFIPSIASCVISLIIWVGTLHELTTISSGLVDRILETQDKYNLSYRRNLSLKLNRLVRELGYAMGCNMLSMCLIFFGSFVLFVYGALVDLGTRESYNQFVGLVCGAIFCGLNNYLLCESGHRATQSIKNDFCLKILKMNVTSKSDEYISEIELIIKGMIIIPPEVEYNGFITANRQMFTHIVGNTVTYLIVLVQFNGTINCRDVVQNNTLTN